MKPLHQMTQIIVTEEALAQIQADGISAYPNECCGFLYGTDAAERIVSEAVPVINSQPGDQRRRFEISPEDYRKAEIHAVVHQTQLLGVYHSHPDHPAIASVHDLEKALPYFSYVILSVRQGVPDEIKSWRLRDDVRLFEEEKIHVHILK